jgi:hypothetical protein
MRLRAAILALLAAASAEAAAAKSRSFHLRVAGRTVHVAVPEVFEPLLPRSVYPNRRAPASLRPLPLVVVDRVLAKSAEPLLLERGCLVAVMRSPDREALAALLGELPRRVGREISAVRVLSSRSGDLLSDPDVRAAALFEPTDFRPADAEHCVPVELYRRTSGGDLPDPAWPARCVREKWYRTSGDFPGEAFRDAAEWLAAEPPGGTDAAASAR